MNDFEITERVEQDLDQLILRRRQKLSKSDAQLEEQWRESERRFYAEPMENRLFGWVGPRKPHELGAEGFRATGAAQGIRDLYGQEEAPPSEASASDLPEAG
jgi:hypothetical protein